MSKIHKVAVEFTEVESTLGCGLRTGWISGKDKKSKTEISLDVGAGVGSPWLMFTKTVKGKQVIAMTANASKIIMQLDKIKPTGKSK